MVSQIELVVPGPSGSTTTPGRVYLGKRMSGHMGNQRVSSQNVKVILVDSEKNLFGCQWFCSRTTRWFGDD